jgi:hypothetical protein
VLKLVKRIASLRTILEGTQQLYEASTFPAACLRHVRGYAIVFVS